MFDGILIYRNWSITNIYFRLRPAGGLKMFVLLTQQFPEVYMFTSYQQHCAPCPGFQSSNLYTILQQFVFLSEKKYLKLIFEQREKDSKTITGF